MTFTVLQDACAQIKTSVTFSNPYLKQIKAVHKTKKEYKKYLKDSIRKVKELNKYFDLKIDSLSNQIKNETLLYTKVPITDVDSIKSISLDSSLIDNQFEYYEGVYLDKVAIDSFNTVNFHHTDSLNYQSLIKSQDSLRRQQEKILIKVESNIASMMGIDYLNQDKKVMPKPGTQLNSSGLDQIKPNQNMLPTSQKELSGYKSTVNRYRDKKNLKSNLKELSNSKFITQNKQFNEANKSLAKLKRKYLTLPSSKDLSSGVKRNSLKGEKLNKRLVFGGSIKVRQSKSIEIDFSPSIAYLISKRLSTGIAIIYRGKFGDGKKWHESFNTKTYGGRIFTDYTVLKSFYAHTELESINTPNISITIMDIRTTKTILGAMAGIGKHFSMSKGIVGKVIAQYNFLHNDNTIYSSPWVVRFGFDIKKRNKK